MEKKIHLSLCQGTSCPFNNSKTVFEKIKDYLRGNNLENRVEFSNAQCCGKCNNGLKMEIDGNQLHAVNSDNVSTLLDLCLQTNYYC